MVPVRWFTYRQEAAMICYAIAPVCRDVYLDGTTRINREFPPFFETDYERHVVSLQLGNSPDGSHYSRNKHCRYIKRTCIAKPYSR